MTSQDDQRDQQTNGFGTHAFVYRGNVPLWLGLGLAAPVLLVAFSLAAALVAGGTLSALVLPFFLRGKLGGNQRDPNCIELDADQYTQVDSQPRKLPPK